MNESVFQEEAEKKEEEEEQKVKTDEEILFGNTLPIEVESQISSEV